MSEGPARARRCLLAPDAAGGAHGPPPAPTPSGASEPAAETPLTEGERWSREQLGVLLGSRFSPPAIGRFLLASQRRAGDVRRARPELARQSRRWIATGAGAWLGLAAAGTEPFRRRVRSGLLWWGAVWIMLDWHLGMLESEDGAPRALGPADALTLGRAWLVPAIADSGRPAYVILAAASDGLDGFAARATVPTRAGRDLEGLVDAVAFAAALRAGLRSGALAQPVVALELLRLGAGFAYAVGVYFGRAAPPDRMLTGAARLTTPIRVAGLAAAGSGRGRVGGALVGAGSVGSLAALARALRGRNHHGASRGVLR